MPFMIRHLGAATKLGDQYVLEALTRALPRQTLAQVIADLGVGEQRRRKLPAELTVVVSVAMSLFPHEALERVLSKLLRGLRLLWPDPTFRTATKSAICQARYALGARPLAELFRRVRRPLASPTTPGAFRFGLRLMALDSTLEDVPDTPMNARAFGYPSNQHGRANFPQVLGVYLVECGTHAVVDAGFWPGHTSVVKVGNRLLRSVTPEMLVLWDRGFHSADLARAVRQRDAHFLGRVPRGVQLRGGHRLADGSRLVDLWPAWDRQRRDENRLRVRVIEYTHVDPHRPHVRVRHRLMTSLLDPTIAPALEVICLYHERWEIELVIDELDTHQRLAQHPLRSQKPVGVIQELYGLLLAHYAIRAVMVDAAASADLDPRRLSFVQATHRIVEAIGDFQLVDPTHHAALYQRLLTDIQQHRLPPRQDRINPRVVKRTRAKYPPKRRRPLPWPQPTMPFREAVRILI